MRSASRRPSCTTAWASTGKAGQGEFLRQLGAQQIVPREELQEGSDKAMLKERWAGAVDTVGGEILFNVVKSLRYGASVACCGLTAGMGFKGNVAPFMQRCGASGGRAWCRSGDRARAWSRLGRAPKE